MTADPAPGASRTIIGPSRPVDRLVAACLIGVAVFAATNLLGGSGFLAV